jgi:hypothetical protein
MLEAQAEAQRKGQRLGLELSSLFFSNRSRLKGKAGTAEAGCRDFRIERYYFARMENE